MSSSTAMAKSTISYGMLGRPSAGGAETAARDGVLRRHGRHLAALVGSPTPTRLRRLTAPVRRPARATLQRRGSLSRPGASHLRTRRVLERPLLPTVTRAARDLCHVGGVEQVLARR